MNDLIVYTSKLPSNESLKLITLDIDKYLEAAENLVEQAKRAEITDEESYAKGGDLISIGRSQSKKAEDERLKIVGPFNKLIKYINSAYKLPKEKFTDSRSVIEAKMMTWKRVEDERQRAEADKVRKKLEADALAAAAKAEDAEAKEEIVEQAKAAIEVMAEGVGVGLARGTYGSSTGTRKTYSTEVVNIKEFIGGLIAHIDNGNKREIDLSALIEFRTSGMNKLAETLYKAGVRAMPGAKIVETEGIRVY